MRALTLAAILAIALILYSMGYGVDSWQYWAILGLTGVVGFLSEIRK